MLDHLKPTKKELVYHLVTEAGIDTSDWPNYERTEAPASNPKYCYNWSFERHDRVVVCVWFEEMKQDADGIFQNLNYRDIAASRRLWDANQRKRAADMDHALQLARNRRLPIRAIIIDGTRRADSDGKEKLRVERRMLDPEPWHLAAYDDDGNCRLQRGPWPEPKETFAIEVVTFAGSFSEGAQSEVTTQVRERSLRLRDLAREHFAAQSSDRRLHCAACDWAPPPHLELSGPIVEIHHGIGISTYPADGRELTFEEAIVHLTPLCPNCHRIVHSRKGGGNFTLDELRQPQARQD